MADLTITLDHIRRMLAQHAPNRLESPRRPEDRAAVAMVCAGPPAAPVACFILRAVVEGDRWSGQMALPGGRGDVADPSPFAVAVRETAEEVGLQLTREQLLGALSDVRVRRRGLDSRAILSPFVFYLGAQTPPLRPNTEVQKAYWIPLAHLWDRRNCTTYEFEVEGKPKDFPGIRYADQIIWGLTYRVLWQFGEVLGAPLPCGPY